MIEKRLTIEGMSCQHCVMRVKKAIEALPGIAAVTVSIGSAQVSFDEKALATETIVEAVEKAGYKVPAVA